MSDVCKVCTNFRPDVSVVQCDSCDDWIHCDCIGITKQQAEHKILNFYCGFNECKSLTIWRREKATPDQKRIKLKHYFEVERIKDHRGSREKREFLVEWKNCPVGRGRSGNVHTWEPEGHLDGAIDFLQQYCRDKGLPASVVEGLMGASSHQDHDTTNWLPMSILLDTFARMRTWLKLTSFHIVVTEWTGFGNHDGLFFLKHDHHCFVLLYIHNRKSAYIADGSNEFRTNEELAQAIRAKLGIRLISLEFNQQRGVDHCVSSAILIGLELLRAYSLGTKPHELKVSKYWRNRLVKELHPHESAPTTSGAHRLNKSQRHACSKCSKTFITKQGMNMHFNRAHKK